VKYSASSFGDFKCAYCHVMVSSAHFLSGVNNRNHCPYCLWSCHLDLCTAGDRLSACKGRMKPVGLTMKHGRNKYRPDRRGELMLVHQCIECSALSINRIAADDDPSTILAIFQGSLENSNQNIGVEIILLSSRDGEDVYRQLYGGVVHEPAVW